MEVISPRENDIVITTNPTITVCQKFTMRVDGVKFKDTDSPQHIYLITTPRLRYLNKFKVGKYVGSLNEFIGEWKARNVDINILRFERCYIGANQYAQHFINKYEDTIQDGWINTTEGELKREFDRIVEEIKFGNIDFALGAMKLAYKSYDDLSSYTLGILTKAINSVYDVETNNVPENYCPVYNIDELRATIKEPEYMDDEDEDDEM